MRLRLYPRPELWVWLIFSGTGASVSALTVREMHASIWALRRTSLNRPHAHDVIKMAQHNQASEAARLVAQGLFLTVGVAALFSKPPVTFSKPRIFDKLLPWLLVGVEGILVGNSLNEYMLSRRVLRRRTRMQNRSEAPQV